MIKSSSENDENYEELFLTSKKNEMKDEDEEKIKSNSKSKSKSKLKIVNDDNDDKDKDKKKEKGKAKENDKKNKDKNKDKENKKNKDKDKLNNDIENENQEKIKVKKKKDKQKEGEVELKTEDEKYESQEKDEKEEKVKKKKKKKEDEEEKISKSKLKITKNKEKVEKVEEENEVEAKSKNLKKKNSDNIINTIITEEDKEIESILNKLIISSQEEREILIYMIKSNRPYSANNISDNLKGKYKKKQLTDILISLTNKNYLLKKTYASDAFLVNQEILPKLNEEEFLIQTNILTKQEERLKNLRQENFRLASELKMWKQMHSEAQLFDMCKEKKEKIMEKRRKIEKLKGDVSEKVATEVMLNMIKQYEENKKKYNRMKKTNNNVIESFSDAMNIKKEEFIENNGIENVNDLLVGLKLVGK